MSHKPLVLLGFCCLIFPTMLSAQEESEAAKAFRIRNDSLVKIWRSEYARNAKIKQDAFMSYLDTVPSDSLKIVDGRNMLLQEVPDLEKFTRIESVNFENNALVTLPKTTFGSDSLQRILIGHNELKKARFKANKSVRVLALNNNKLKKLPRSIRKLKNLRSLNLEGNQIKRIPRFIKRMDSLEDINLNFNHLKLNRRVVRRLSQIEAVSLGGNKLESLPPNIYRMQGVKSLNLGKNQLSSLPPTFANLKQIELLIFYENKFSDFPREVLELHNLKHLDFYYNQLTSLPEELGELIKLEQLFLSFNQLQDLPKSLQGLDKLVYFYAHNNQLMRFPEWIKQHQKLQRVGLSNNRIINLPDLSAMPELTDLDVQNNLIDVFPWELLYKEGMQLLTIKNNAFNLSTEEREKLERLVEKCRRSGFAVSW